MTDTEIFPLSEEEVRVLGSLIEKAITTPDYYPLTLNAVITACNQKSNRSPVVSYDEGIVERTLESLRKKGLAEKIYKADSRVAKYQHLAGKKLELSRPEIAVMCELMLRGPQTMGELRGRAERMHPFAGLQEVEDMLQRLISREPPFVFRLRRQTGQKESRYTHLLAGMPEIRAESAVPAGDPAASVREADQQTIARLKEDLAALRREFDELKQAFLALKSELE